MTDTAAREEAVERVRAYVEAMEPGHDDHSIDGVLSYDGEKLDQLLLGDLRLLLSGGEGGSVAIASREGRAVIANLATEELLALVLDGDHRRGCQGREYTCSCGYDTRVEREATTLRSALTDPRQPSEAPVTADEGWRPIESAPRDGTVVDLWDSGGVASSWKGRAPDCFWSAVCGCWIDPMGAGGDGSGDYVDCYPAGDNITHWRPLPPAPPTGEGGGL